MTDLRRHGTTIFCDDIRFEVGNKTTFVGVYGPDMYVVQFPITLPKFCVASKVVTPQSHRFSKQVEFRVYKDDEVIACGATVQDEKLPGKIYPDDSVQIITVTFIMSPLIIEGPCTIKVRAYDDDGDEVRIGALKILSLPLQTSSPPESDIRSSGN